jgi:acetyl esterase/lipase
MLFERRDFDMYAFGRLILVSAVLVCGLFAEARVEKNVIYGMYSGLALLMDIHYPEQPNGYGVIHISGSGWSAPLSLDARPLKESGHVRIEGTDVVAAGYTLFTVNHRATPRFKYPAPLEDVQRAVRFVRFHASKYGISPDKIGGLGGSSGGHLVSMLGMLDGDADSKSDSEIDRLSSKIQAAVVRVPPADFSSFGGSGSIGLLLDARLREGMDPSTTEMRIAIEASPVSHASADDPPFLLIHGDADETVPFSQSEKLRDSLKNVGVKAELVRIKGAGHGPGMPGAEEDARIGKRAAAWFDRYLRGI